MLRKISSLFERRRHAPLYPTVRAELDAVRDRKKAIAMEVWPRDAFPDPDHAQLVRLARARGLQIIERPVTTRSGIPLVAVYALQAEEAWRIAALHALWHAFPAGGEAWSDGAEALESHLLGYTDRQIAAWLAARRHQRLGWTGETVYLLGPTAIWADGTRVLKPKPPRGLGRVAIPAADHARLFPGTAPIRTATDTGLVAVQRLGPRGWVPV